MTREDAISFLEGAISRIENHNGNANGGDEQTGGAYWRLARVLKDYLEPRLDEQEGKEHADFIRKNHGVIVKS